MAAVSTRIYGFTLVKDHDIVFLNGKCMFIPLHWALHGVETNANQDLPIFHLSLLLLFSV